MTMPLAGEMFGEPFIDTLPDLVAKASETDSPLWVVEGVICDGLTLIHSQPRELKSLTAQQLGLHVALGTAAFGLQRLHVATPRPVLYVTEEDAWRRFAERSLAFCCGLGLDRPPANFHTAIGKGIDLDDPEWQGRMIAAIRAGGYGLTILDPIRSLSSSTDQGPRELRPLTLFLRRLLAETGCPLVLVHHDTKPGDKPDARRRPQRASGGGIFSIADAPIAVEPLDEHSRLLVPTAFKFSADPPPVAVRLHSGPGWLRLEGSEHAAQNDHAALDARILTFLSHSPYTYGSSVAKGVQAGKALVLARLKALAVVGAIDSLDSDRGVKWFLSNRKAAA